MDKGSDSARRSADDGDSRHRQAPDDAGEGTFADVFNSFTFDGGWRTRRRKESDRDRAAEAREPAPDARGEPRPTEERAQSGLEETPGEDPAAIVRSYVWTRGRTRSDFTLELETLVSTSAQGQRQAAQLQEEHYFVVQMCSQPHSVAEIAALLSVPLGVARVLVGDVAERGLVHIHESSTIGAEKVPSLDLIERLLSGLRKL